MADRPADIAGLLHAWRRCGAGRRHGIDDHRIEALAARAARLEGHARQALDTKLRTLLEADLRARPGSSLDAAPPRNDASSAVAAHALPTTGLSALALRLSEMRATRGDPPGPENDPVPCEDRDEGGIAQTGVMHAMPASDHSASPTLPALDAIRRTWAQLRNASHLQHIVAEVPEDAGPMHSTVLVHRAIALMHEAAPAYLQHFLGYVDALAGLERLSPMPATTPAPRSQRPPRPASPANASGPGKAPRRRSRGRPRPA